MTSELKNYRTIDEIREDFEAGRLTPQQTVEVLSKKETQKAWHSKEWREKREQLIKDKCEQCGTSEPPMVLQHMWHPDKLATLIRNIANEHRWSYAQTHPKPQIPVPPPEATRKGCPHCGKFSGMNWRKTMNNWRCQHCRNVFEEKADIPVLSPQQEQEYYTEYMAVETAWEAAFTEAMGDTIFRDALRKGFEQHDRYVSCVDTVTFCKKCAFMWDRNKRKICEGCGKWTPIYTTPDSCWTCLDKIFSFDESLLENY